MTRYAARVVIAALAAAVVSAVSSPFAAADDDADRGCPALFAVGVQSPGQAAEGTAADVDSGLLGEVLRPLATRGPDEFQRVYVRMRPSGHGITTGTGPSPFETAVVETVTAVSAAVAEMAGRCPQTRIAVVADAQAASAASLFAQQVGAGRGPVPAQAVAAVALFADPTRAASTSVFPGANAQTVPNAVPGTGGKAVSQIEVLAQQPLTGAGIAAAAGKTPRTGGSGNTTRSVGYGALTGRVASFCVAGDLACDTSDRAPVATVVANMMSSASESGGDPLRALASLTQALAFTAIKTATTVVNQDVSGTSVASLSLSPKLSLSQRLAQASDPRTPLDINAALRAVLKVGTIAVNSVITIAKAVLTPTNLAEIAAAGLANPAAGLAALGAKLVGALPQLIPPATASRLVGQAFNTVVTTITDNTALIDTTTWVRYSDALSRTGAYTQTPVAATGRSPVQFTTDWLTAALTDLADAPQTTSPSGTTVTPTPPTSPSATSSTATSPSATSPTAVSSPPGTPTSTTH